MDLLNPFVRNRPPQWPDIPLEMWEALKPKRGFFLPDEMARLDRILAADWLLLHNVHHWRCGRCGGVHEYYTSLCIERPMHRLSAIHGLLQQQDKDSRDLVLDGISLGTVEPITRQEAERMVWKIRFRGGSVPEWKDVP